MNNVFDPKSKGRVSPIKLNTSDGKYKIPEKYVSVNAIKSLS